MRKLMLFLTIAAAALSAASAVSAEALRAPGGGTIRALVVGVDVYSRLPASVQLQGARADAEDIAEALQRGGVKPVTLFDTDVTRARIVSQMDSFVADSKPGDFVLFAYAGHGMQTPEYARWQGIDANGVNEQIALSGFSFSGDGVDEIIVNPEIRAWLTRLDAKGVDALVVMDSCFGGGMREVDPRTGAIRTRVLRASAAQIRAGEDERAKFAGIPMTEKEARANVELMSHVTFLAGATSRSVVPETDGLAASGPRGALSYYLARALRGEIAKDGVTTRQALFGYLKPNIRGATQDRQLIQVEPQSSEPAVYGKPVLTFAEAAPAAQAANTPPAADNGAPADNGAAPSAQAQNAPSDATTAGSSEKPRRRTYPSRPAMDRRRLKLQRRRRRRTRRLRPLAKRRRRKLRRRLPRRRTPRRSKKLRRIKNRRRRPRRQISRSPLAMGLRRIMARRREATRSASLSSTRRTRPGIRSRRETRLSSGRRRSRGPISSGTSARTKCCRAAIS